MKKLVFLFSLLLVTMLIDAQAMAGPPDKVSSVQVEQTHPVITDCVNQVSLMVESRGILLSGNCDCNVVFRKEVIDFETGITTYALGCHRSHQGKFRLRKNSADPGHPISHYDPGWLYSF